ncbi:MAG: serine hydroxymethyltransferase [Gammaproteobacteria bacterium]|nr:MAG: serine hydroxymethyltransferase [Gammaproteobacteria bacterium]
MSSRRRSRSERFFFDASLTDSDTELAAIIAGELRRQADQIELIASENLVSRAVLEAQGSVFTNKTVEGYPGRRYYGGTEWADALERLAVDRACRLFACRHANVQPHSGSQANQTVYQALLAPGDRILSMGLAMGGHLSHGAAPNQSGRLFDVAHYGVRRQDGRIDMDEVAEFARSHRPKLIIAGASAYPRVIDFAAFRRIADAVGAWLLVDMAHIAGLVAGGAHPSPIPHAHVTTTTTYKSLRGARGGMILTDDDDLHRRFASALFPGIQGSAMLHAMAGKAACLGEALTPEFADYAAASVVNAQTLAAEILKRDFDLASGGTDTSLLLLDLRSRGITGRQASDRLEQAGLTCNKNAVPFDSEKPTVTSGLRVSSAVGTTRGFGPAEFAGIGHWMADVLDELALGNGLDVCRATRQKVGSLCAQFPIYAMS